MSSMIALILVAFICGNKLLSDTVPPSAPFQGWNQWKIDKPMPDTLDMVYLLTLPKYRNIHHDSFCREDNFSDIGNNALPDRPNVMAYKTISRGDISVGVKNRCSTNHKKSTKYGRCIKYINAGREDYHITVVNSDNVNSKASVAFYIKDIDNFYCASLTNNDLEICKYLKGKKRRIFKSQGGGKRLEFYVNGKNCKLLVDGKSVSDVSFRDNYKFDSLCGLLFDNEHLSEIEDFLVDYPDSFVDAKIDEAVENDEVSKPVFGSYCAFKGRCTTSTRYVKSGLKSYRFELLQPTDEQVSQSRNNALHSTVMLNGITSKGGNDYAGKTGGNKPLDSFVFSVDVLFPGDGDEVWMLDDLFAELFIQEHHVAYKIPFSPSISICILKGRLFLQTISMEHIARGTTVADNDLKYRVGYFCRLNSDEEEIKLNERREGDKRDLPQLKKNEWHNITMYVKLGYNENQKPRTVIYLDNVKCIDWDTPNAYNCQEYGEYLEFGIYKWSWNSQENRDKTPIKKRVLYFDNVKYYI